MTLPADFDVLARSFQRDLKAENKSPKTRETYGEAVRQFGAYLAGLDEPVPLVADIAKHHVAGFMLALEDAGRSAGTRNNRYRSLQAWFKYLAAEDEIGTSPMATLAAPKVGVDEVALIPAEDIAALLATCGKGNAKSRSFEDVRDEALILVLFDTGLRRSEAMGLALDDLDLDAQTARVTGKGNRPRTVTYGTKVARALDRYLRRRASHADAGTDALWLGRKGPLTTAGLRLMLNRRTRRAGIAHIFPHQFRHTFSHLFLEGADGEAGGNEADLMALNGWTSPAMLRRYGRAGATARAHKAHRRLSPADRL